ncbi:hypothetical protein NBRC116594_38000 [Shimia sp. NS0008-38b]
MPKTRKGVFGRDHAKNDTEHKGGERNQVIAKAPPEQHDKNAAKQAEKDNLIGGHKGRPVVNWFVESQPQGALKRKRLAAFGCSDV